MVRQLIFRDKKLSSENAQKPPPGEMDHSKSPQDMSGNRHTYYMVSFTEKKYDYMYLYDIVMCMMSETH